MSTCRRGRPRSGGAPWCAARAAGLAGALSALVSGAAGCGDGRDGLDPVDAADSENLDSGPTGDASGAQVDGGGGGGDGGLGGTYFCVSDAAGDRFVLRLDDPDKVETARDMVKGTSIFQHVGGQTGPPVQWNPYWSFHIVPSSAYFFEASIEICDAAICYVHQNESPTGTWCPWTSHLEYEIQNQDFTGCVGTPSC